MRTVAERGASERDGPATREAADASSRLHPQDRDPPGAKIRRMMQLSINGERRAFAGPLDVASLVDELALGGKKIAVERNGEIVPRSRFKDTQLADGDRLEIVVAVGGG